MAAPKLAARLAAYLGQTDKTPAPPPLRVVRDARARWDEETINALRADLLSHERMIAAIKEERDSLIARLAATADQLARARDMIARYEAPDPAPVAPPTRKPRKAACAAPRAPFVPSAPTVEDAVFGGGVAIPIAGPWKGWEETASAYRGWYRTPGPNHAPSPESRHEEALKALPPLSYIHEVTRAWKRAAKE